MRIGGSLGRTRPESSGTEIRAQPRADIMKITLIQPPRDNDVPDPDGHCSVLRPFSLFYLAAYLKKQSTFEVRIVDLEHRRYRGVVLEEIFGSDTSRVFGITATTNTRFQAIKVAAVVKRLHPESVIVVGGVHFSHCAEDTLSHVPEIDVVVRGEGELPFVELCNAISCRSALDRVKGITYRRGSQVFENPAQDVFVDLDEIPDDTEFTWDEYPEFLFGYPETVRALSVMSSRGCPYNCIFCSKAGMKYRVRDPVKVVDEIELLKVRGNIRAVNFVDLTFTASPAHVSGVCNELIRRKLDILWWCQSRANIDLNLLGLMKEAGCVSLFVGVESGSPSVLSRISKGISCEQVTRFIEKCAELGIRASAYFMFSHPDETAADVRLTLALIDQLERAKVPCAFHPTVIFPGTELEKMARQIGLLDESFSWCTPYESDLNRKLGQLTHVPLFMHKLSGADLLSFLSHRRLQRLALAASEIALGAKSSQPGRQLEKGRNLFKSPEDLARALNTYFIKSDSPFRFVVATGPPPEKGSIKLEATFFEGSAGTGGRAAEPPERTTANWRESWKDQT